MPACVLQIRKKYNIPNDCIGPENFSFDMLDKFGGKVCVCVRARARIKLHSHFFSPPGPLHIRPNHGGTTVHTARQAAVPSPFNITTLPVQQKIAVVLHAWCCLARVSLCSLALHFHYAGVTVKHLETRGQVLSAAPLQVDQLIIIALGIVAYRPLHVAVRHMAHCTLRDDKLTLNSLTLHSTCAFIHSPAPPNTAIPIANHTRISTPARSPLNSIRFCTNMRPDCATQLH